MSHSSEMAKEFYDNHKKEMIECGLSYENIISVLNWCNESGAIPNFIVQDSVNELNNDLNEMWEEHIENFGE